LEEDIADESGNYAHDDFEVDPADQSNDSDGDDIDLDYS
jgi:hypothetical protein